MTISNEYVKKWVEKIAQICRPDSIYWCNGSEEEFNNLAAIADEGDGLIPLNEEKWPGCYAYRTSPENSQINLDSLYICTHSKKDAADTRHWMAPRDMMKIAEKALTESMTGKILYVIPYVMGPIDSPFAKVGIELTDSIYVVLNMSIISRIGDQAWHAIGDSDDFIRGVHLRNSRDVREQYVAHFPQDKSIIAINTEYGGLSFHSKASAGMVLGSATAVQEGWLAEHMMIVAVENPEGEVRYIAGAFPSSCGKSSLAFLTPPAYAKGYKCYTVGDDIAWLRVGPDGRLWAINPEAGFFSVLPGLNTHSNPRALAMLRKNSIFTNVAVTNTNEPWWEGMGPAPRTLTDWQGDTWTASSSSKAAHPNSRFTAKAKGLATMSPHWEDPAGVPISAIVFGGKSAGLQPLVVQAENWVKGVFMGATLSAQRDFGTERNPMGILPFLGTSLDKYLRNWLAVGEKLTDPPGIFRVNWFRKNDQDEYLWPGYSENFRVLQWILGRTEGKLKANKSVVGKLPLPEDIHLAGLDLTTTDLVHGLLSVDKNEWLEESKEIENYFRSFQNLPEEITNELNKFKMNLT